MNSLRQLQLEWEEHQGRARIAVVGWTETELRELADADAATLSRRLAFYPSESLGGAPARPAVPPVAGSFLSRGDVVLFVPRFPLSVGTRYSLLVDCPDTGDCEIWTTQRPARAADPVAEVLEIYPTASEVPLNLLRLYVQFSHPMSESWAMSAISVGCQDTGESLEDVFLPPEPELWDAGRSRLTMLLDPGRIKRGLAPNLESGYPLAEGMTVVVTIDRAFRDARGQPLRAPARRIYRVGPAMRSRADPAGWTLNVPPAASSIPLRVEFDRSLDHGLLQHSLSVQDPTGAILDGVSTIGHSELSWSFTPEFPWHSGEHRLLIEPRLEDVAGNTPIRVFDRDVSRPEDDPLPAAVTHLSFICVAR